jgi:hypothetical protein
MSNKLEVPVGEPDRLNFFSQDYNTLQSYSFYDKQGNSIGSFVDVNNDVRYDADSTNATIYMFSNGAEYGSTDPLFYTKPPKESVGSRFTSYFRRGGKRSRKNRRGSKKLRKGVKKSRRTRRR